MACKFCKSTRVVQSVTPLGGSKMHLQFNCLDCGSGWQAKCEEPKEEKKPPKKTPEQ